MSTLVANQTFWYGNRFFVRGETLVDSSDPVVAGHSAFFDTWAGGGGGGADTPVLHRTGILNFADSEYPGSAEHFSDVLIAGAVLVRAWAIFDFGALNYTGATAVELQMWLTDTGDTDGALVAKYDLASESPGTYGTGLSKWLAEPNPLNPQSAEVFQSAQRGFTVAAGQSGFILAYSQGDGSFAPTAGTYELFAMVLAP